MTRLLPCLLFVGASLSAIASANDANDEAIRKDRNQIEGRWRVVTLVVNGSEVSEEDRKKITVVNRSDGTWSLISEGDVMSKGTSSIDPMKTPKTIDFTVTEGEGEGNQYFGIYELGEKTRKMCFAPPNEERPTEFMFTPGSKQVCIKFERKVEQQPESLPISEEPARAVNER